MAIYSDNRVINGSAENGILNWITQNAISILGGTNGSRCFEISSNGKIEQGYNPSNQPKTILIEGNFLPEEYISSGDVKTDLQVLLDYADGTQDIHIIPCKGSENNGY